MQVNLNLPSKPYCKYDCILSMHAQKMQVSLDSILYLGECMTVLPLTHSTIH